MSNRAWRKKLGILTASATMLLSGVSGYALHELNKINTEEFANSTVNYKGQKIPLQEFYENLTYKRDHWVYTDRNNNRISVDLLTDFELINKKQAFRWRKINPIRHTHTDTVKVSIETDNFTGKPKYVYKLNGQKTFNIPALGKVGEAAQIIRHFVRADGKKDANIEIYNKEHSAEHEGQHWENKNPGDDLNHPINVGQVGQSYKLTFVEMCEDEISANIKQLMAQRKDCIENGMDLSKITPRFKFWSDAVKEGKIHPTSVDNMSPQEKDLVGNGVVTEWLQDKYNMYEQRNTVRAVNTLHFANYNAVLEDRIRHIRVVKHIFNIDGIDFSSIIFDREHEILHKITQEQKDLFAKETAKKKQEMKTDHRAQLEYTRRQEGNEAYNDRIARNVKVAQANKTISETKNYIKEHYAKIKRMLIVTEKER